MSHEIIGLGLAIAVFGMGMIVIRTEPPIVDVGIVVAGVGVAVYNAYHYDAE